LRRGSELQLRRINPHAVRGFEPLKLQGLKAPSEVLARISNLNFLFDRFLRSASKQVEDKAGGTSLTPKLRRHITPRLVYDEKGNALATLERLRKTHSQRRHVDFVERGDSILLSERYG
jgi:hypothetical protein